MLSEAVAALRRVRMSTVDNAWLRMDSEGNLMVIVAVLMFDRLMDMSRFRHTMETRFLKGPRCGRWFRSTCARRAGHRSWAMHWTGGAGA